MKLVGAGFRPAHLKLIAGFKHEQCPLADLRRIIFREQMVIEQYISAVQPAHIAKEFRNSTHANASHFAAAFGTVTEIDIGCDDITIYGSDREVLSVRIAGTGPAACTSAISAAASATSASTTASATTTC